ncbi:hypothetical protein M427DRAFT_266814 [Gonapodya prolifera JEL478]|uniref:Uncharacterized protein n=1 Tax=Gonapodya prolifera (strain JEL478) TaxID=1344416 RepID=A0A138ZXR2_GONPJ|nr:hypothetical protein M427DRAFT_266814 [Gonapodya prolifera JEL478]|eukprot:KXS08933.1 hypothetical protein M427DRAFT_266814 [Gonapodya prolifera JEL478]
MIKIISLGTWSDPSDSKNINEESFTLLCIVGFTFFLIGYEAVQFVVVNGVPAVFRTWFWVAILIAAVFEIGALVLLTVLTDLPFWFYYIDFIVLALTFIIVCFGYSMCSSPRIVAFMPNLEKLRKDPSSYQRARIFYAVVFVLAECLVAISALVYCVFLLPIYASLEVQWQIIWRLAVHPAYFELLVFAPLRAWSHRHLTRKIGVLPVLVLAHAQLHKVVSGMMAITSITSFDAMLFSVIGVSVFKFFWRSTIIYRGVFVNSAAERVLNLNHLSESTSATRNSSRHASTNGAVSNNNATSVVENIEVDVVVEDRYEAVKFMVATELSYEMILETAAVIFTPILNSWMRPHREVFAFHGLDSTVPVWQLILTQLVCFLISDHLFLQMSTNYFSKLPFQLCWKNIRKHRFRIHNFLIYGTVTMGVICQCYFMYKAPRYGLCSDTRSVHCPFWESHDM